MTLEQLRQVSDIIRLRTIVCLATPGGHRTRWLRSPHTNVTNYVWFVYSNATATSTMPANTYGFRPALYFTLTSWSL